MAGTAGTAVAHPPFVKAHPGDPRRFVTYAEHARLVVQVEALQVSVGRLRESVSMAHRAVLDLEANLMANGIDLDRYRPTWRSRSDRTDSDDPWADWLDDSPDVANAAAPESQGHILGYVMHEPHAPPAERADGPADDEDDEGAVTPPPAGGPSVSV
jgi:hypothetical protein